MCNMEGLIEYVNPALIRFLQGKEEKDIRSRFIGDFCTSFEAANTLMKTPSSGTTWFGQLEITTITGETREVLATSSLSKGSSKRIVLTITPLPKSIHK